MKMSQATNFLLGHNNKKNPVKSLDLEKEGTVKKMGKFCISRRKWLFCQIRKKKRESKRKEF